MHGKRRRKSPLKVDLTKKEGLGPREKETDVVKFEMGNPLGFENPVARQKMYEKTETENIEKQSAVKTRPMVFTMGPTDGTEKKTTGLTNPFFPKIGGSRKKSKNGKRTK